MTRRRLNPRAYLHAIVGSLLVLGSLQACKENQPPPSPDSSAAKRKTPPMPWAKKAPPKKPTPDESWIKDLKAISPKEVVRRYLTLSTKGDLTKVKPFVAEHCYKTPIGAVTATLALGSRLIPDGFDIALQEEKDDVAVVSYEVRGSLKQAKKAHETNIFGVHVEVRAPGNNVTGIKRTGKLHLKRIGGAWQVACPQLKKVKPGLVGVKVRKNFHRPHLRGLPRTGHKDHKKHKGHDHEGEKHKGHDH